MYPSPLVRWLIFTHLIKLRDIWAAESAKQGGTGRVDVLSWLCKMTLDVIGLAGVFDSQISIVHLDTYLDIAGFHYKFDALTNQRSELNDAFDAMFKTSSQIPLLSRLKAHFPIFRILVSFALALPGHICSCKAISLLNKILGYSRLKIQWLASGINFCERAKPRQQALARRRVAVIFSPSWFGQTWQQTSPRVNACLIKMC
jgi:hypothetical protein